MQLTLGIGELQVSGAADDVLVTFSLGSCIGVTVYDPVARVGGMVHCLLPLSRMDPGRARNQPGIFVDTGVCLLLRLVLDMGADRERLQVKMAGGAAPLEDITVFQIGERNREVCLRLLEKNRISLAAEDTGGTLSRTLYLRMADGRTTVRASGCEKEI